MYIYCTARGIATLSKSDDKPLVKIGKYKTEAEAKAACEKHYAKAKAFLERMGKPIPVAVFV